MATYYVTVFLIIVFSSLAEKCDNEQYNLPTYGVRSHSNYSKVSFILAALVLIIVGGLRYGVGTDYWAYYSSGDVYFESIKSAFVNLDEPGISVVYWLIRKVTLDGIVPMFVFQLITVGLMLRIIYRYSDQLLFSILLFVFLGCWHFSFNAIRQCLAGAIIFCGFPYLREKKFWKYAFVCLIAFLFHRSAIVMLAIYFIVNMEMRKANIALISIVTAVFLLSYDWVIMITEFVMQDSLAKDAGYADQVVNILRVLVAVAPALFYMILFNKRQVDGDISFYFNLTLVNAVVMIISSRSAMIARVGIYTAPFVAISIPELNKGLDYQNRKIINVLMCILYGIYFFYEITNSSYLQPFAWAI